MLNGASSLWSLERATRAGSATNTGIPQLKEVQGPSQDMRDSELLYNEPKYIRMDEGGLHTFESNGLKMKQGVYY